MVRSPGLKLTIRSTRKSEVLHFHKYLGATFSSIYLFSFLAAILLQQILQLLAAIIINVYNFTYANRVARDAKLPA